jgi:hypothetical protein
MILKHKKYFYAIILFLFFGLFLSNNIFAATPQKIPTLSESVKAIFDWSIGAAAVIAAMSLAIGGVKYSSSLDNSSARSDAKSQMISSIVGLILLLGSFIIIQTINPKMTKLEIESLKSTAGIYYSNGDATKDKPAPAENPDTSDILNQGYQKIKYKCINNSSSGIPLLVWFYPEKYFYDPSSDGSGTKTEEVLCGGEIAIEGASFKISFENPGVYLFLQSGCTGFMSEAFTADEGPLADIYLGKVKSFKIINGNISWIKGTSNFNNYGVIFHDTKNTNDSSGCTDPTFGDPYSAGNLKKSDCKDISNKINPVSMTIFNDNIDPAYNPVGLGVKLFSKPWGWQSGSFAGWSDQTGEDPNAHNGKKTFGKRIDPTQAKFTYRQDSGWSGYNHDAETSQYQQMCQKFSSCPGSIQTVGNFLVILASNKNYYSDDSSSSDNVSKCQVFTSSNINSVKETQFSGTGNSIGTIIALPLKN